MKLKIKTKLNESKPEGAVSKIKTDTTTLKLRGTSTTAPKLHGTSWTTVSEAYDKYLGKDSSYHKDLILPNLMRLIGDVNKKNILDVACGQGFFSALISNKFNTAKIDSFDLAETLINIAKENANKNKITNINYHIADAVSYTNDIKDFKPGTYDLAYCVLAIQNIENVKKVIENVKISLKDGGRLIIVMNHPSYRIPKFSSWGYDNAIEYRRVDKYMIEDKIKLDMTPSEKREAYKRYTYSFHRPLQYYFKIFKNLGLKVTNLEEWTSNKESVGKNSERENIARKEFPVFMAIEVMK